MRHIIKLFIPQDKVDGETKMKDIRSCGMVLLNSITVSAAFYDWNYGGFVLYVQHQEFDVVGECEQCPFFVYSEARRRYPFLFTNTNPLLYRKFKFLPGWGGM